MRVLVTGGSGVVGEAAVRALVARGHTVRLLARHAAEAARRWPDGVEAHVGDVTDADSLRGAADACDAVLHCVGIVDESPPELTFDAVNVEGTRRIMAEATRARVPRFVFVSSLGADRGASAYHESKRAAEAVVRAFDGQWLIVRPGNVYGPGDEVVSLLLKMVRTLPVVPVIGDGAQPFQPIWADDVGEALATATERTELAACALDIAGPDRTSMRDLIDRFARLTNRDPARVPLPNVLAGAGLRVAESIGITLPINDSQLTMLAEGNVIDAPATNALVDPLGVAPTSLDDGLRKLLDALPEQLPDDGVGALHRKRYRADIRDATISADALFARLCTRFHELTPDQMDLAAEPDVPTAVLHRGQTVTMALPARGNVQVRVAELDATRLTLLTVEGHPLAGAVRFTITSTAPSALRAEIELFERAASVPDWLAMATIGGRLQNATWRETIERIVAESGGVAPDGVQVDDETLDGDAARSIEAWLRELAVALAREQNASGA